MSTNITDIAMTDGYDLFTFINENGERDIEMACNHEVVSNLVQTRLQYEINHELFISGEVPESIAQQQVRTVVRNTYAVIDVDLSGFVFTKVQDEFGGLIDYGTLCWTTDCANSKECYVL